MTISGYNTKINLISFPDQTTADVIVGFKAPEVGATILRAYFISDATFDADASNHYTVSLIDGGATGTGTTSMGSFGGASIDTVADTQNVIAMTTYSVDGSDWIHVSYAETGTVAPGNITVCIEWTAGGT